MSKDKSGFQFLPFVINLAIPLLIGAVGSIFTSESVQTWYTGINKPAFNPPNSVFGPVWSTLYCLIGIAAYLVWKRRHAVKNFGGVAALYFVQLLLNLGWSFIFFSQHLLLGALIEIVALLVVIVINTVVFFRIRRLAGILFVPYILWVAFATYLTYSIYILN